MTAPRLQRPGSVHAMISAVLDAAGRGAVVDEIGASQSTLSRWADPDEGNGRQMPVRALDQVGRLFPAAAAEVAKHFAALGRGVFVPLARDRGDLGAEAAQLVLEAAQANARLSAALGPGSPLPGDLTPREAAEVSADLQVILEHCGRLKLAVDERLRGRDAMPGAR